MPFLVFALQLAQSRASQTPRLRQHNGSKDITRTWHSRRPRRCRREHSSVADAWLGSLVVGARGGRAVRRDGLPELGPACAAPDAPRAHPRSARGGAVVNPMLDLRQEVRRLPIVVGGAAMLDEDAR